MKCRLRLFAFSKPPVFSQYDPRPPVVAAAQAAPVSETGSSVVVLATPLLPGLDFDRERFF